LSSTALAEEEKLGGSNICPFATIGSSFSTPTKSCPRQRSGVSRRDRECRRDRRLLINRRFMFMGRWLRHAYYPNWNLRLFRHSLGRYEKLTDAATASGDNEVHEHVVVQGPTGRLRCELDHYAFPSVEVFVEKHNRYSNWEARVAVASEGAGNSDQIQSSRVAQRRRLKAPLTLLAVPSAPPLPLRLPLARGFLDGREVITSRVCTPSTNSSPSQNNLRTEKALGRSCWIEVRTLNVRREPDLLSGCSNLTRRAVVIGNRIRSGHQAEDECGGKSENRKEKHLKRRYAESRSS
jgi:hypothetical protein